MIMVNITFQSCYNMLFSLFSLIQINMFCASYQQISTGVGYWKVTISQELWPTFITYQKAWEKMRASIWKTGEENGYCFQTNGKLLQSFTQLKLKEMQLLFLKPCMKSTLIETISQCSTKSKHGMTISILSFFPLSNIKDYWWSLASCFCFAMRPLYVL